MNPPRTGTSEMNVSRKSFVVVVSGPSGVGKSTVVDRLLERMENAHRSVSVTTRGPRGDEHEGDDYFFVSNEEFERRRNAGELLEWAEVHGNLYGTPAVFVEAELERGVIVVLEIDVQGGMAVKKKRPDAVLIFLLPPTRGDLERRLRGRGTDENAVIERRLGNAERELGFFSKYDYAVVNDNVGTCVEDIVHIIQAESLRLERSSIDITY